MSGEHHNDHSIGRSRLFGNCGLFQEGESEGLGVGATFSASNISVSMETVRLFSGPLPKVIGNDPAIQPMIDQNVASRNLPGADVQHDEIVV